MESLRHAQQQFVMMKVPSLGTEPVMNLATVSRQPSTLGDGDFETEEGEANFPRTPRGSSRASHVSSLAHSHRYIQKIEKKNINTQLKCRRCDTIVRKMSIEYIPLFLAVVWRWKACLREVAVFYPVIIRAETSAWKQTNNRERRVRCHRKRVANPVLGIITDLCI